MNHQPDFIIIGAMKCATSTLHDQLAMQPGIFMSQLKEPNFFSDDQQYARGFDWYLDNFRAAQSSDLCGESSTHYTKLPTYPHTVQRLAQQYPQIKLIYVMRHPVERLVSQYIHEWTQNIITEDINQAVEQYSELIDYSRYSLQLEPYLQFFSPQQILPVFFERMLSSKQLELARICRFIGYQEQSAWIESDDVHNASSDRIRKNKFRDLLVEAPGLKAVRQNLIPKSWRNWVRSWWQMSEKPQLEAKQLNYLEAIFDRDLVTLGSWLGLELSCENFKAVVKSANLQYGVFDESNHK